MSAQWMLLILLSVMLAMLGAALVQLLGARALSRMQARERKLEDSILGMESATPYLMNMADVEHEAALS